MSRLNKVGFALPILAAGLILAAPTSLAKSASAVHAKSESFAKDISRTRTGRLTVLVDAYPASLRLRESYIPVRIAIAVTGKGRPVRIDRESFALIDEMGHATPMAGYTEFAKQYSQRLGDAALFRARPMVVGEQFGSLTRVSSHFFPAPGRQTATSSVELPAFSWTRDVLYFPGPITDGRSQYTLRISSPDLKSPIEVPFRIPGSAKHTD